MRRQRVDSRDLESADVLIDSEQASQNISHSRTSLQIAARPSQAGRSHIAAPSASDCCSDYLPRRIRELADAIERRRQAKGRGGNSNIEERRGGKSLVLQEQEAGHREEYDKTRRTTRTFKRLPRAGSEGCKPDLLFKLAFI